MVNACRIVQCAAGVWSLFTINMPRVYHVTVFDLESSNQLERNLKSRCNVSYLYGIKTEKAKKFREDYIGVGHVI